MAMGTKNRQKVIEHVASLDNFEVGNVKGGWYPDGTGIAKGRLPETYARQLCDLATPVYVVYSYGTPIAWRCAGGSWVDPGERYSAIMSHHQSLVRQGMRGWDAKCDKAVANL